MNKLSFTLKDSDIKDLLSISEELFDLGGMTALLQWDQETYMPPKGILHRSRQLATISAIFHAKLTQKWVGETLKRLEDKIVNHPNLYSDADQALYREMKRDYEKAKRIPERLVKEMAQAASDGLEAWKIARQEKNFAIFSKPLETLVRLKMEEANLLGYKTSPYDALLDEYEPGLTAKEVQTVFDPLKKEIVQLLNEIKKSDRKKPKGILRGQKFPKEKMIEITEKMLNKMGFDFQSGRQDLSAHPFTTNFGHLDVRVTNRYFEDDLASSIFSAIHEGGHALYELGITEQIGGTLLASGTSLGVHESQSRLWENLIGRSREFWQYWTPYLKGVLPKQLKNADAEKIYHEVNWVAPGFIRVDADEVTYNLHIILRFEVEKALIEQKIKIKDLPEVWNQKMQELLGITPPNDALGVLQDIHWSQGSIGYFPTYTLGNLYAAQIWQAMQKDVPKIHEHIKSGNFEPILHWLRINIHHGGSVYQASELIKKVTGEELNPRHFIQYLQTKFNDLTD